MHYSETGWNLDIRIGERSGLLSLFGKSLMWFFDRLVSLSGYKILATFTSKFTYKEFYLQNIIGKI